MDDITHEDIMKFLDDELNVAKILAKHSKLNEMFYKETDSIGPMHSLTEFSTKTHNKHLKTIQVVEKLIADYSLAKVPETK